MMTRKAWAKVIAWVAGGLGTLATASMFGKYSHMIMVIIPALSTWAVHLASDTSAGHPNGYGSN